MSYTDKTDSNGILCEHYPAYPGKSTKNLKVAHVERAASLIIILHGERNKVVPITEESSRLY